VYIVALHLSDIPYRALYIAHSSLLVELVEELLPTFWWFFHFYRLFYRVYAHVFGMHVSTRIMLI
jgi:hypothetical protein